MTPKAQIEAAIAENALGNQVKVTGTDDHPIVWVNGAVVPYYSLPEHFIDAIALGKHVDAFLAHKLAQGVLA